MYLKDDPKLLGALETGPKLITAGSAHAADLSAASSLLTRLGGLMEKLAEVSSIDLAAILAVWLVESSGRQFTKNKALLRMEVHLLFDFWGKKKWQEFDVNFRFGTHNGQPGRRWENHEYRTGTGLLFSGVHHNQASEYAAFALGRMLAGDDAAMRACSIGGPQILLNNYALLGYATPMDMYSAFQQSERAHVLGFFDFCRSKPSPQPGDLLRYLQVRDWESFAKYYNGPGRAELYAKLIGDKYRSISAALKG